MLVKPSFGKIKVMFEKLNAGEIEELLQQQLVGRIGCHANGLTYVVPVSYAYDGNYIYCHTFEGMKVDMMRSNPDVCFEVDNTKNLANWQSVIVWGSYEELSEGTDRSKAIEMLRERKLPILSSQTMHLGSQWPFVSADDKIEGIIFRIYIREKTGRYEKSTDDSFFAT
jgi:nitroimidazol reductase NimA-like FMN-containing flavoprotein (pyridoxamine 5'-phosphate oxidase superfamily)